MTSELWDTIWSKKLVTSSYSQKYREFMYGIEKTLPRNSKVLEAGCGTGQTLQVFDYHHTTGLDISQVALNLAKNNCDETVQGNILSMPFEDEEFDLVYNSGVIEHFLRIFARVAVDEMARVTKRSGTVVVIVPNTYCIWYRILKRVVTKIRRFEFGYEDDYTWKELKEIMEEAGLKTERVFGYQVFPPLASNSWELLPECTRRWLGHVEQVFPKKEYYAYAVGIVARKE